jgi:hypothetical protein
MVFSRGNTIGHEIKRLKKTLPIRIRELRKKGGQ